MVALGASNLTRGFPTVVATARSAWGPDVEVLVALGHGRSYGAPSRVLVRTLPGILQSGLWQQLERLPTAPTRGLITDVGNDILYGSSAAQILEWVEQSLERLQQYAPDIVLTDLPLASLRGLSRPRFLLFRSMFFPSCRLSLDQALETAEEVDSGLAALAASRGARFTRLKEEWYGFDPIHIRPSSWRSAWQEILCGQTDGTAGDRASWLEALRLYLMLPDRQWVLGVEQVSPQSGAPLPSGGRVWLY